MAAMRTAAADGGGARGESATGAAGAVAGGEGGRGAETLEDLRASLHALAEDNSDLRVRARPRIARGREGGRGATVEGVGAQEYTATLKKAQKAYLERMKELEETTQRVQREKAELAAESARLRVQGRESAAAAEEVRGVGSGARRGGKREGRSGAQGAARSCKRS
jgi:hypothetical protein